MMTEYSLKEIQKISKDIFEHCQEHIKNNNVYCIYEESQVGGFRLYINYEKCFFAWEETINDIIKLRSCDHYQSEDKITMLMLFLYFQDKQDIESERLSSAGFIQIGCNLTGWNSYLLAQNKCEFYQKYLGVLPS